MASADEHRIETDNVAGAASANNATAASINSSAENSSATARVPAPLFTDGADPKGKLYASLLRLDHAVSEHDRAAEEWRHQLEHKNGHRHFLHAEADPAAFYRDVVPGNPAALAAARNYNFALPPHHTLFSAARSAYRDACSEWNSARDDARAQLRAEKEERDES